jgi:PAS domain S-box-containing protein
LRTASMFSRRTLPDRTTELQRCIRDLVAISTLPAIWRQHNVSQIAQDVADALVAMLGCEFVYVLINAVGTEPVIEVGRTLDRAAPNVSAEIWRALKERLSREDNGSCIEIENPGGGGSLHIYRARIGLGAGGVIAVGSTRQNFPKDAQRLILSVAANQAAIAIGRRRSDEALRRSEQDLNDFFENATTALHWVGPDGTILRANKAELTMLGYSADEYIGHHVAEFHADKAAIADILQRLSNGEAIQEYPARLRCKSGAIRSVLIDSNVCREDGRFLHTRCFTRDVSDHLKAEEELRRLNETLEERVAAEMASRLKVEEALQQARRMEAIGQLAGGIAHDFNNLMMVIGGNLEILRQRAAAAGVERQVATMERALQRGESLTRQLLSFSRQQPHRAKIIDLGHRLPKLVELIRTSLRGDIEVAMDTPEDVWPIEADPGELELSLLNIAVNARDAMPNGGKLTLQIEQASFDREVRGDLSGDFVRISIIDTGHGIPDDVLPKIFEPFYTTKQVGKGTGLGLSQVYGFAKQSGGRVEVNSEVGRGTKVSLFLPRAKHMIVPQEEEIVECPQIRGSGVVLFVEDNDDVAQVGAAFLTDFGYTVKRARNVEEALAAIDQDEGIVLVVTDIVMPGQRNGLDLVRELRHRFAHLPVLLTTGYSAAAGQAKEEGFPILAKPFQRKAFATALREVVENRA